MGLRTKLTGKFTVYLLGSLLAITCVFASGWYYKSSLKRSDKVIGQVGPFKITESQVQYQMAVNAFTIPKETDREYALKQVKEIFSYQTIMQNYGWEVSPQHLEQEEKKIENSLRSRRVRQQLQKLTGFNRRHYRDIFVRGTLVRRLIVSEFYHSRKELHNDPHWIEKELQNLNSPEPSIGI